MSSATGQTVYVVTGGNRGIGLGLVKKLLARPSTIVIASVRNSEAAASLKAEANSVSNADDSILYVMQLDFSSAVPPEDIRAELAAVAGPDTVNHVDVLICNAGVCPPMTPAAQTSAEDLRAAFETNTVASLLVFQAFWPLMKNSPSRTPKLIMMTSSVGGITAQEPVPGGAYGPSRAAQNWLTRALHIQNEADGLVSVALHPGWAQTRLGEFVAKEWNYPADPPVTVEDSVTGMLEVIDGATRDTFSGKFVTYNGQVLPW